MPIKEATFWVGVTVFGTGLFGWMEGGDRVIYAIVLTLVGAFVLAYAVWSHHIPNLPKLKIWVPLLIVTWIAIGFDYYSHRAISDPLPEFDQPQAAPLLEGYGKDSPNSCFAVANGDNARLQSYSSSYRIAMGCFVYTGMEEMLDAPLLQVSNLYDIKKGPIPMRTELSAPFQQVLQTLNPVALNVVLFLVPKGVEPSQFSTLRQARDLNVKIIVLATASGGVINTNKASPSTK